MEKMSLGKISFPLLLVLLLPAVAAAINFNGILQNSAGVPLAGITVFHDENSANFSAPSGADGGFTVPNIPSGVDFHLKFDDATPAHADGYSRIFNRTTDASAFVFTLFTPAEIAEWYAKSVPTVTQTPNGGTIRGRVIDARTGTSLAGAVVTFTSALGQNYPVYYHNGISDQYVPHPGLGTFANGRYHIFNVLNDDFVMVSVSKPGWVFNPITFHTHSGNLNASVGNIFGNPQLLYLPLILKE